MRRGGRTRKGGAGAGRSESLFSGTRTAKAAAALAGLPEGSNEATIQDHIAGWLREAGIDYTLQYRTATGPIDIHLKHMRCIIEVKTRRRLDKGPRAPGTGSGRIDRNESAFDQVSRYIDMFRKNATLTKGPDWRGAVTDGRRWWIWEWSEGTSNGSGHGQPTIHNGWDGRRLEAGNMDELAGVFKRDDAAATSAVTPWAPDDPTGLFTPFIDTVRRAYERGKSLANTRIQKRLWLEQLMAGGVYPDPADEVDLFVRHTILILVARMVSASGASKGARRAAARIMDGFVGWVGRDKAIVDGLEAVVNRYDWRENQTDVMRALYMGFIPQPHRKSYGEYYTPDWLAEKMCMETVDEGYIARQARRFADGKPVQPVLDPACGSGTFLHHAAMVIRGSNAVRNAGLAGARLDAFLCEMVQGIDLHPVAVEMAIANVSRMLPGVDPSRLHIHQGDSMLADTPRVTLDDANGDTLTLRVQGETITLPRRFVANNPDDVSRFVAAVVANTGAARLPAGLLKGMDGDERRVLRRAYGTMADIVERHGNGVWGWYIRNQSAPMLLSDRKRVARIVSNAPWVRFKEIRDRDRKEKIVELGREVGVYQGTKMKTAMDIAAIFVARCDRLYLADNGRSAWVLPYTAVRGTGQWERLRGKYKGRIREFWELGALPFPEQMGSCAMLTGKAEEGAVVRRLERTGRARPEGHDSWGGVVSKITRFVGSGDSDEPKAVLPRSGRRVSAWVTGGKKHVPLARQGATLTPSMLVRIDPDSIEEIGAGSGTVSFRTLPSRHGVWKGLGVHTGRIPGAWVRRVVRGADILPFVVPRPTPHVIPIGDDGEYDADRARRGYWRDACRMYEDNRGTGDHTPKTLEEQLDYHGKLSAQFGKAPAGTRYVVYNTSGERLYAAVAAAAAGTLIVESSAYRVPCRSLAEAHFLAAIMNADAMQRAFYETKRADRHYHTYFWKDVPIPRYDASNAAHRTLSELGARAAREAGRTCRGKRRKGGGGGGSTGRKGVVKALRSSGLSREIDKAVKKVLPKYVADVGKSGGGGATKKASGGGQSDGGGRTRAAASDLNQMSLV